MFHLLYNRMHYWQRDYAQPGTITERNLSVLAAILGTLSLVGSGVLFARTVSGLQYFIRYGLWPSWFDMGDFTLLMLVPLLALLAFWVDWWKSHDLYEDHITLYLLCMDLMTTVFLAVGAWIGNTPEDPAFATSRIWQLASSGSHVPTLNNWFEGVPWPFMALAGLFALVRLISYSFFARGVEGTFR